MSNRTIQSVSVVTRDVLLEVELRGSRPHIGKFVVAEITRRALAKHGLNVSVVSKDGDHEMFKERTDEELAIMAHQIRTTLNPMIRVIDNNSRVKGSK